MVVTRSGAHARASGEKVQTGGQIVVKSGAINGQIVVKYFQERSNTGQIVPMRSHPAGAPRVRHYSFVFIGQ
jgi:hypothetical protein